MYIVPKSEIFIRWCIFPLPGSRKSFWIILGGALLISGRYMKRYLKNILKFFFLYIWRFSKVHLHSPLSVMKVLLYFHFLFSIATLISYIRLNSKELGILVKCQRRLWLSALRGHRCSVIFMMKFTRIKSFSIIMPFVKLISSISYS